MSRLFIHAINVHKGGGAVLLCDLLQAVPADVETILHVDRRFDVPTDLPGNIRVERVEPTLLGRFAAERRLAGKVAPADRVLCFGNLPPFFKLRGEAVVFLQNRYLVDPCAPLVALPFKPRIRLLLERTWLRTRRLNASQYIVQTESMQRLAEQQLGVSASRVPFVPQEILTQVGGSIRQRFDFLYVASGEAHKNHVALIEAWCRLADDGIFPSLVLTLSPDSDPILCACVEQAVARGLLIQNVGVLPRERLLPMYSAAGALIYPSSFESFGLPLIEARRAGLPILAPELDYVRDITDPDQTFDPQSPVSIARAVRRHLDGRTRECEFCDSGSLLRLVLGGAAS